MTGEFTTVWQPIPKGVAAREALAYLCALVSLGSGVGLLWRRTAGHAARVLLGSLVLWLLAWRVRAVFVTSLLQGSWSLADAMVMTAGTWVLSAWFATDWDRQHLGVATGEKGVRIARVLYGLGLIPFGYAHFANLQGTAALVPGWLPWHLGWAYFTGGAFIAAGVAILIGVLGRQAATLSALQMGLFAVLVWLPRLAAGWVVADSYSRNPDDPR